MDGTVHMKLAGVGVVWLVAVAVGCLAGTVPVAAAGEAWWEPAARGNAAAIESVLGSSSAAWDITDRYNRPVDYTLSDAGGRPVLASGADYVNITSRTRYTADTEILVTFRLVPPTGGASYLVLSPAVQERGNTADTGLRISVSAAQAYGYVSCSAPDPQPADTNQPYATGYYYADGVKGRALNWPERMRKLVEHDIASLRPLEKTWLTLRCTLLAEGLQVYLNDRVVLDRTKAGLTVDGFLRMELAPHVELASVRARPFTLDRKRFQPVFIGQDLNASRMDGQRVRADALPAPGAIAMVQGVPFVFPGPDDEDQDHIDVGCSWIQTAYLENNGPASGGGVGGRWLGAAYDNPARLQFRIPGGRYRALHLVAASDGEPDSTPVVTAQFFRPGAGFPESFSTRVPLWSATSTNATPLPVTLDNGKTANLYHVVLPIEPGALAPFDDLDSFDMEITKEVRLFRAYPDPTHYSTHAAGLPSSAHVYALTLERPAIDVKLEAGAPAHVWTAPEQPTYTVALRNQTGEPRTATLTLSTRDLDAASPTEQTVRVPVPPGGAPVSHTFTLALERLGWHALELAVADGDQVWHERRSLAYLHADTRERGDWERGRGPLFGFPNWGGGHLTPSSDFQLKLMALAGAESQVGSFSQVNEATRAVAEERRMVTFKHFGGGDHYITRQLMVDLETMSEEEAVARMLEALRKTETKPSAITQPTYISFFPEPLLGMFETGGLPEYWGEPPYELTAEEEERYRMFERAFIVGARAVKKEWPNAKCLLPHGDPLFPVYFLRRSAEVRELIDGVTVDIPCFERLPEQQLHQVSLHRMYLCREEFRKAGIPNPLLPMDEGPCLTTHPASLTYREHADLSVRDALILLGYGVNPQLGGFAAFDCASYWGEQHYGGGVFHRIALMTPKPAYVAFASMTRHLNRKNFTRWLPTGSLSVYALLFTHYKTGERLHVLWTLRGTRPVTLAVPAGATVTVFDQMDNHTVLEETDGTVTFAIDSSPRYVVGLAEDARVSLGAPDHADARPAAGAVRLGNPSGDRWEQSAERDAAYENNTFHQIRRYPGAMTAHSAPAPDAQGGQALAVHLGDQAKDRKLMPFYTTLVPRRALTIPGKASHLGLWVKAASDWGRVVYSLRDAEGERWLSVGTKDDWNCDDIRSWSAFCFDGWRYLRFELPASSPYDSYREIGTTWWGHPGPGDGIVDLPLQLEKIMVERRTHALYVNCVQPTSAADVQLGDLYAEYAAPADKTEEAVRLSRLRMPVPEDVPALGNPIRELRKSGVGEPTAVTRVTLPDQQADGTRSYVHFEPVAGAKTYDIWVSPYPDGNGAIKLGSAWAQSGQLIQGLHAGTDFYLFVTYEDADAQRSKPSDPYKIHLQDAFAFR